MAELDPFYSSIFLFYENRRGYYDDLVIYFSFKAVYTVVRKKSMEEYCFKSFQDEGVMRCYFCGYWYW